MLLIWASQFTASHAQLQTTHLDEVEIVASPIHKFGIGALVTTLDSAIMQLNNQSGLASLLSSNSSLHIKQYGAGMLSTVSFRGTGAGHTAILWNGLQVGYPFLGQADLSLFPADFASEITLLHGSSSARYGSGALGGMISLGSGDALDGLSGSIDQSIGSFGALNSTLQVTQKGAKGFVRLSGIYQKSENNFPYKSERGEPLGKQENSSYSMVGGLFESTYFLNKNNSIQLNVQSVLANKEIQPFIGSNSNDLQNDNNLWSTLIYTNQLNSGNIDIQYGYLFDRVEFNGGVTDSKQNIISTSLEKDWNNKLSTEVELNTNFITVGSDFYETGAANEMRTNVFVSTTWNLNNRLSTSINLGQAFVTGFSVPFTPSIGLELKTIEADHWKLSLLGQLAKGYKVPTLNDRFWVPGGNPNLKPEESVNAEVGLKLKRIDPHLFWINLTGYQLWVNNWILWLPQGSIWSPENKRKVNGSGIELESGVVHDLGSSKIRYWVNYAYTQSTNVEAVDIYDRSVGKQLPYVPFHNGNISALITLRQWSCLINAQATGKRYITADNESEVPGYILLNAQLSYTFLLNKWGMRAYVKASNLTNTNYQSTNNKAMPGINFLAGLKVNFKN